jgi:hypothetical protein
VSDLKDAYVEWLLNGGKGPRPASPSSRLGVPVGEPTTDLDALMKSRQLPEGFQIPGAPVHPDKLMEPIGPRALEAPGGAGAAAGAAEVAPWLLMGARAANVLGPLGAFLYSPDAGDPNEEALLKLLKGEPLATENVKPSVVDKFQGPLGQDESAALVKPAAPKPAPKRGGDTRVQDRISEMDALRAPQKSLEQRIKDRMSQMSGARSDRGTNATEADRLQEASRPGAINSLDMLRARIKQMEGARKK